MQNQVANTEVFFSVKEVLALWEAENSKLSSEEIASFYKLKSTDALTRIVRPAALDGLAQSQGALLSEAAIAARNSWKLVVEVWRVSESSFAFEFQESTWASGSEQSELLDAWEVQNFRLPSEIRNRIIWLTDYKILELLEEWENHYGKLNRQHRIQFLMRPEVEQIVRFPKSEVKKFLLVHKKLKDLYYELQQSWIASKVDLQLEARKARQEFDNVRQIFGHRVLRRSSSSARNSSRNSEEIACNECGMIIGLFNMHEC